MSAYHPVYYPSTRASSSSPERLRRMYAQELYALKKLRSRKKYAASIERASRYEERSRPRKRTRARRSR